MFKKNINYIQGLCVKKCHINEFDEAEILEDNQCDNFAILDNIKNNNIAKAAAIMCYLVYIYKIQGILRITEYEDLVYGTYDNDEYLFIIFKGTSTLEDVITDLQFFQKDDSYNIPGEIHSGFYDVLKDRFQEFIDIITRAIHENKSIIISGHSLGGALATVLFSYIQANYYHFIENIKLYTFGCPRVGDKPFANFISSSNKAERIVNKGDIVTMIPIIDYYHHDKELKIGKRWNPFPSVKAHSISRYITNM
jgi:hypothetical protein